MREEMVKLEKVKRSCKTSKVISQIMAGIVSAACVICLVVPIILGVVGIDKVNTEIGKAVESGQATFYVDDVSLNGMIDLQVKVEDMVNNGNYAEAVIAICIFAAVVTAICAVLFWALVSIFKTISVSETPFTEDILRKLRVVFIMIAIIFGMISGFVAFVIAACICWSLYTIFDYGFVIQQEINETL